MTEPRPIYITNVDLTGPRLVEAIDRALGRTPPPIIIDGEWVETTRSNEIDLIVLIDEYRAGLWSAELIDALDHASTD